MTTEVEAQDLGDIVPEHLTLLEALNKWCDPEAILGVVRAEMLFSDGELRTLSAPILITSELRGDGRSRLLPQTGDRFTDLRIAWADLIRDFKHRIEHEEMYLDGLEPTKDMGNEREALRGALATDFDFDFLDNTVTYRGRRFLAVTASRTPSAWAPLEIGLPTRRVDARPYKASDLTDEQILELLEEHAKRVLAGPDAKLIAPGRISLMPLVAGKMRDRAAAGEMANKISHEAEWLAKWVKSKVTLHQVPSASAIERSLGKAYTGLKAASKAGIRG